MKTVKIIYFKESGKFYTDEEIQISENISFHKALKNEIPQKKRIKEMYMSISDSGDGKEPYIIPTLFPPTKQ